MEIRSVASDKKQPSQLYLLFVNVVVIWHLHVFSPVLLIICGLYEMFSLLRIILTAWAQFKFITACNFFLLHNILVYSINLSYSCSLFLTSLSLLSLLFCLFFLTSFVHWRRFRSFCAELFKVSVEGEG